jgi:hypothetical protein
MPIRNYSRSLIDEPPLLVLPTLATQVGLHEAIVLQQIHYWLLSSNHEYDERKWLYNSYPEWGRQFPFLSVDQIRRAIEHLEDLHLLLVGNYNKKGFDRTKWYTIDYDALDILTTSETPPPSGKFARPSGTHARPSGTHARPSGTHARPIPETNTETNTETTHDHPSGTTAPDGASEDNATFNAIWETYPRRNGKRLDKQRAITAYNRMSKSDRAALPLAIANYAASGQIPRDMCRFLARDYWREWLTPAIGDPDHGQYTYEDPSALTAEINRIIAAEHVPGDGAQSTTNRRRV